MCGIWGLIANDADNRDEMKTIIRHLFILSESRGKEASGISCIDHGNILCLKMPKPATELIRTEQYNELIRKGLSKDNNTFSFIGHSRLVTNGSELSNDNNQPVCHDGISVVHNGIIVNVDELWKDHSELKRTTDLDTEVFTKIVAEKYCDKQDAESAVKGSFGEIQGTASVLMMFADKARAVAATNNGSLYYWRSDDRNIILFSSEGHIFCELYARNHFVKNRFTLGKIVHLNAGKCVEVDLSRLKARRFELEPYRLVKYGHGFSSNKIEIQNNRYREYEIDDEPIKRIRRCTRCVLPETMPYIEFDENGVCNYCRTYQKMQYKGADELSKWAQATKRTNLGKEYNSVVSFSGGRDSSYGLHYFVKELGLKPVAYNYDWGMVTDLARRNQARMCAALGIELITVSADIKKKRENIRNNILAWIKKPDLGMVPLFMAGDKAYFYYANVIKKRFGLDGILLASNPFEVTYFKSGFCGVKPKILDSICDGIDVEKQSSGGIIRTGQHYGKEFLGNPSYFNSSLVDTVLASLSYYMIPHDYFRLYDYIPWDEKNIDAVLINGYDWETATDTESTWRIGDGTAPFYNYIYYSVCGFTENDTLRSNQIREGVLDRENALELVYRDNQPRWDSLDWYFDTVGLDGRVVLDVIKRMKKLYGTE